MMIDASGKHFYALNKEIREHGGEIKITGCLGQRFIASGLRDAAISIDGIPGNALGAYLNGATVIVNGNAQNAVGDTMNEGKIIIHGNTGDAIGYAMRGGEIYVKGNAGYRAGIHMKAYADKLPVMVIGGSCGCFLGEYQAGGTIIVLGLDGKVPAAGDFCGTGMHGGKIFLRGSIKGLNIQQHISIRKADKKDMAEIAGYLEEFSRLFDVPLKQIFSEEFYLMTPDTKNPYKQLYVQN